MLPMFIFSARFRLPGQNFRNSGVCNKRTSKFIGVNKSGKRWSAHIYDGGRIRSLGTYDADEEAARAYDDVLSDLLLNNPRR